MVAAVVSAKLINDLLALLDNSSYSDEKSGISLRMEHASARFSTGFPRITVKAELGHSSLGTSKVTVQAALALVLDTTATDSGDNVIVRPVFVDFEPGSQVPAALKTIVSAEAISRINAALPALPIPVPKEFKIEASATDVAAMNKALSKIEAPLPNGSAVIAAQPPELPSVRLQLHPVVLLATSEALVVMATTSGQPLSETNNSVDLTGTDLQAMLSGYGPAKGEDIVLTVPNGPVNAALNEFNQRPSAKRTVTFTITGKGHIQDKSGGAPFGNGYQSWFEGTPSGKAELSNLHLTWAADRLDASLNVNVSGRAQVHVHGNAPKPLGFKIGGGAGTSVGVPFNTRGTPALSGTVSAQGNQLKASLQPGKIPATATITGVVNIPVNVDVPLPENVQVNYALPDIVSPKPVDLPKVRELTVPVQQAIIKAQTPSLQIKPDGLRAAAAVKITRSGEVSGK